MPNLFDQPTLPFEAPQAISLQEFNERIESLMTDHSVQGVWVQAETSDLHVRRGHCYLSLIQKNPDTGITIAKVDAVMWASVFQALNARFHQVTGQEIGSNMKVMVKVNANFHRLYGLKAIINDINPEFTLGDLMRKRLEIIKRLSEEGIINDNKQLTWPEVPQRIAVISAAGAAGYGDFIDQLHNNRHRLKFYTCLFPAMMQGQNTPTSIIAALDSIASLRELFDCVVIIRGGGSTADLNWFDDYDLAANVAQFPLPVITGIGHDRDTTVLDYVAALSIKTPTAVAEFLVGRGAEALNRLNEITNAIAFNAQDLIAQAGKQLAYIENTIPLLAHKKIDLAVANLNRLTAAIPLSIKNGTGNAQNLLRNFSERINAAVAQALMRQDLRLKALDDKVQLLSPQSTLNRGYSMVTVNGKAVTDVAQLRQGDSIVATFKHGSATATVNSTSSN